MLRTGTQPGLSHISVFSKDVELLALRSQRTTATDCGLQGVQVAMGHVAAWLGDMRHFRELVYSL